MEFGTGYTVSIYRNLPPLSFQLAPPLKQRAANSLARSRIFSRAFEGNTIIVEILTLGGGDKIVEEYLIR